MDLKNINRAIEQIAEEKGIKPEDVVNVIETAIAAAYKKEYGKKGEVVKVKMDLKTGALKFWQVKTVVDENTVRIKEETGEDEALRQAQGEKPKVKIGKKEERILKEELETEEQIPVYNPDRHIFIDEAKKIKSDVQLGEELEFPLEEHEDFGRIAAQTAKQVLLQRIREAERDSIKKEYQDKEGEIVSGVVQRIERGNVYIDLGRATGILFYNETIPGEHYRIGERLRFFVVAVQEETRIPGIILSRSHPRFVVKLFELEVPEIHDELVEIKAIAREAGSRTKIAAASKAEGVDPVGSLVGQRGTRVMAVTNELGQEKIDIIEWSEDPGKFIASALSPAKVSAVEILPRREAKVLVPEDQLSLAIGKGGQNVRLAAKLTGWRIDVRSQSRPDVVQFEPEKLAVEGEEGEAKEVPTPVESEAKVSTAKRVRKKSEE